MKSEETKIHIVGTSTMALIPAKIRNDSTYPFEKTTKKNSGKKIYTMTIVNEGLLIKCKKK